MSKKIIYLFLALLLPGLIFLFLKYFGKNEFDIPVYYEHGVTDAPAECQAISSNQYFVPDSVFIKRDSKAGEPLLVSAASDQDTRELDKWIADLKFNHLGRISLSPREVLFKKCILFLKEPWNAVLIDSQKRIRGYYKLGNRDEMDRLEVELKILLKKY